MQPESRERAYISEGHGGRAQGKKSRLRSTKNRWTQAQGRQGLGIRQSSGHKHLSDGRRDLFPWFNQTKRPLFPMAGG